MLRRGWGGAVLGTRHGRSELSPCPLSHSVLGKGVCVCVVALAQGNTGALHTEGPLPQDCRNKWLRLALPP